MQRAWTLSVLAIALGCGPPRLASSTSSDEGSTTEDANESSTSSGTEASTSSDPPTTSEGSTFTPEEDMPPFQCNQYTQDCPEGEKCVPWGSTGGNWDEHKCVPVLGDRATGEACSYDGPVEATDDCDETSFCWDGFCRTFCWGNESEPECPPMSACLPASNGIHINACIPLCDPLVQDCGEGFACYWANGTFNCIFTTENIPAGQPCGFIYDCAEGLACLIAEVLPGCEGAACCSGFCDLNLGDAPCEALLPGTMCTSFFEEGPVPAGYEHVGVCIVPP